MKWTFILLAISAFANASDCCPPGATDIPNCSSKQYEGIYGELPGRGVCPERTKCVGWFMDVSPLVWRAYEDGLNFALKTDPNVLPAVATVNINGDFVGVDFEWEPAVKVLMGTDYSKRDWDAEIRWTYFHTDTTTSVAHGDNVNNAGLLPIWAFPNANTASSFLYSRAKGKWGLNLNAFDLEMGYQPLLSPHYSLRFNGGLKLLILRQKFSVSYRNGFNDGTNQNLNADTDMKNAMTGVGPRIGFDLHYHLKHGLSLIGTASGSLPLWRYTVSRKDTDTSAGLTTVIQANFHEKFWSYKSVWEAKLGLEWETCYGSKNQYPFSISGSYECQYFPESNMFSMLVNPGILSQTFFPRGDLFFHGATFNFHWGF